MFRLQFRTGNAVFSNQPHHEIAKLLRLIADKIDRQSDYRLDAKIMDANGNSIGNWKLDLEHK